MRLVKCISERRIATNPLVVGKRYWLDELTIYKDADKDEYAQIYLDKEKEYYVGQFLTNHFKEILR